MIVWPPKAIFQRAKFPGFRLAVTAAVLCLFSGATGLASGEDTVEVALQRAFNEMKPLLQAKGLKRLQVGTFTSPKLTSSGAEVQLKLRKVITNALAEGFELSKLEYQIIIQGRIERTEKPLGVRIVCQLFNSNGVPLQEVVGEGIEGQPAGEKKEVQFAQAVSGMEAVPRMLGVTLDSTGLQTREILEKVEEAERTSDSSAIKDNQIVFASDKSPYGVEVILINEAGERSAIPTKPADSRGCTFVEIPDGTRYKLRLHNGTERPVAALVSIDGISTFAFSTVRDTNTRYVVSKGSANVNGWDFDDQSSFEFTKVAGYPNSAAAELLEANEDLGVICVQFAEFGGAGRGTAKGGLIDDKKVPVPGNVGSPLATVVIRYER